jgi:hypothetical protein
MTHRKGLKQKRGLKMAEKVESPLAENESVAVAILESPLPEDESIEVAILEVEPMGAESPSHNEIAVLAYLYWEARGCQGGSPEEDWFRAERELRSQGATEKA